MMHKAHIRGNNIQSCDEHCINTARYSSNAISGIGLSNIAYLCGLIHDTGKFTPQFDEYIEASANGENVAKGSVIHTFAGVRLILERFHSAFNDGMVQANGLADLTAELIGIAVGSHHGQFDCFDESGKSGLAHRMCKQSDYDKEAISDFFAECASEEEIKDLFSKSIDEIEKILLNINEITSDPEEAMYYLGMLARLISSAVIDGDRRDTAEFMSCGNLVSKELTEKEVKMLWEDCLKNTEQRIKQFPCFTGIDEARREMSEYCKLFAKNGTGVYRLNLPTGAGKTISGLRYALKHAELHDKKRIIFAVPLLSVLDQNAKVIRETVKHDEAILEHHSNVIIEECENETISNRELMIDTWDSPIIITTLVQLLNVLFDGKTSSIRRLKSLCDSVIIIDEVQSVPEKMLTIFNLAVNFLSRVCNTTFLLCSATQPSFERLSHKMLVSDKDVIPKTEIARYNEVFRRNVAKYDGMLNIVEISEQAERYAESYGSVLVIVNTKKEACEIYKELRLKCEACYHLSTSMCMAHRKVILKTIKEKLDKKEKVICVSTQLIEAGVDVSFGSVIRIMAGMDSIVQAAGRCNRNGEKENDSLVSIVGLKNENLSRLREIKMAQDCTSELISEFAFQPKRYGDDLMSQMAIDDYYARVFNKINKVKGYADYVAGSVRIFDLLSCNQAYSPEDAGGLFMRQAFKTAGEKFKVFDTDQISVVVPYKDGREIINHLLSEDFEHDFTFAKNALNAAKEYTINIFQYQYDQLNKENALFANKDNTMLFLYSDYYDDDLGLILEKEEEDEWNTLIL